MERSISRWPASHSPTAMVKRQRLEAKVAAGQRDDLFPELFHDLIKSRSAERSLRAVDIFGHVAADDQRHGAFLLRDHHGDGIGLLGDAEGGAMARAPGFTQIAGWC